MTEKKINLKKLFRFIIGAPKANSTLYPVKQSGTVFKCDITSETTTVCHEININFSKFCISYKGFKKINILIEYQAIQIYFN